MPHAALRMAAAIVAGLAIAALAAAPALAAKGNCKTPKTAFHTEYDGTTTTSTEWVKVPRTAVTFKQGGEKASCVVVRFSVLPDADYIVLVRPVIDGQLMATPHEVQLEYLSPGYSSTRSFEFVFPKVKPGSHVLRIEWRTPGGDPVDFYRRTVTVQHR